MDMTTAIKKADLALPLSKRTWLWIFDHPGITGAEISAALKETRSSVATILSTLHKRGMVTREQVFTGGQRLGYKYRTTKGMETYDLLPMPKKSKVEPALRSPAALAIETQAPQSFVINIDKMTIEDAKSLYRLLHEMFGKSR